MGLRSHRWALVVLAAAGALFACNQILGVEDVQLKATGTKLGNDGGPGDDDDNNTTDPIPDGDLPPEALHPQFSMGFSHTCVRMLDSTVRCWGANFSGELGNGVALDASTPDDVLLPTPVLNLTDAIMIGSGTDHTCAVRKGGTVSCWGEGYAGQLGNNGNDAVSVPVDVQGITDAIAIGCGAATSCAVHADGTASCWGANPKGGLGDGTVNVDSPVPVKVQDLTKVVQIAPSSNHTCAVLSTGEIYCWGGGADGQLGTGTTDETTTKPTKIIALTDVAQVAVAPRFSCARTKSGGVYCWGENDEGQLGNGSPNGVPNPSPIAVPNLSDVVYIWAGTEHACAVHKTGAVSCWGGGSEAQLGLGDTVDASAGASTPQPVAQVTTARGVWTGGLHTCIVTSDNKGLCWGANLDGEVGNGDEGTPIYTATPVKNF